MKDKSTIINHPEVLLEFISGYEYDIRHHEFTFLANHSLSGENIFREGKMSLKEFLNNVTDKDRKRVKELYTAIITEKLPFTVEFEVYNKNHKKRIITMKGRVFLGDTGEPEYITGTLQDITSFREKEEALKAYDKKLLIHRERLERTQHLAQVAFFEYDWQEQRYELSAEAYNIMEIDPASKNLNHAFLERIYNDDIVRLRGHAFQGTKEGTQHHGEVEFRVIARDGRVKYLFAQYEHQYNALGHKIKSSGWIQDITTHRINEMALAESEEKYRNMFALESDALFLCNNDTGEILETNASASKLFGYKPNEFKSIKINDLAINPRTFADHMKSRNASIHNLNCKNRNNQIFTAMVALAYFVWKGRNVHLAAFRDISQLRAAEKELELTKFALDHSAMMVYVLRKDGSFHYVNDALIKTLGYRKEEILSKHIFDIQAQITKDQFKQRWENLLKNKTIRLNDVHITSAGEHIPCEVITNFLKIDGEPYKVAFLQDIRNRIEMEEQIRHSEKMNAVGELAGGIAHDFNNQLMGITGYAHLLRNAINDTRLKSYIDNIIRASDHSTDLTGKLLAFSRKGKYISIINNMHEIINECVMLLQPGLGKQIAIDVKPQANNPFFRGDTSSIQNAILNLAINAKDAMKGGGKIEIATKNQLISSEDSQKKGLDKGSYICVSIRDNGKGIQKEHLDRIFEPFFSTKEKGHGTGLGLSATLGTIQAHKGTIKVNSTQGQGSEFTLFLPACNERPKRDQKEQKPMIYGEGKIMLVDDEDIVREVTALLIKNLGYNVIEFGNGSECIEYYKNHTHEVSAVILDLIMPGISGYEVFHQLKSINNKVKVLLFSGYSTNEEVQKALDNGAAGFLQKPAKKEILSQQLAKIAGKSVFRHSSGSHEGNLSMTLPDIKQLNLEKALAYVDGDEKILLQILWNFTHKYALVSKKIIAQLKSNDLPGLYLNIHSIKSLLGNMGAEDLFQKASALETALSHSDSISTHDRNLLNTFISDLNNLIRELRDWHHITSPDEKHIHEDDIKEFSTSQQINRLSEVLKLINQYSPAHIETIRVKTANIAWSVAIEGKLPALLQYLDDYDFGKASELCEALIKNLQNDETK